MLRKLLSILCLASLTFPALGMDSPYPRSIEFESTAPYNTNRDEYNGEENLHQEKLSELDFLKCLGELIELKNEQVIIEFLENNHSWVSKNLSLILKVISVVKFRHVVNFLQENYICDERDIILAASRIGDMQMVQTLTNFSDFITHDGKLDKQGCIKKLEALRLKATPLDEIVASTGINYEDTDSGFRYLPMMIRENVAIEVILTFIRNSNSNELNAQESDGTTPLHQAAITWNTSTNKTVRTRQQSIIKTLLLHGADTEIQDQNRIKPTDLTFFLKNNTWQQWKNQCQNKNSSDNRIRAALNDESNNSSLSFKALAGCSLAGAALFYIAYKLLSKSTSSKIIRLK